MTGPLDWLLAVYGRMLPPEVRDDVVLDVREEYHRARAGGERRLRAGLRVVRQVAMTNYIALHRTARRVRSSRAPAIGAERTLPSRRDRLVRGIDTWLIEIRHAIAALTRSRGFSALAVGTIAVSVGSVAVVTGVLNTVLLAPLPYRDPDRLVMIWHTDVERDGSRINTSAPQFVQWREGASSFSEMAAYRGPGWTMVTDGPQPERVPSLRVTPDFFEMLGVSPELGRGFTTDDASPDEARAVIVSHELWDRLARPDREIGSVISLDERPHVIVGVMPAGFWFVERGIDVWYPYDPAGSGSWDQWTLRVVARLSPGTTAGEASETLAQQHAALLAAQPGLDVPPGVIVRPLLDEIVGNVRGGLIATGGAVLLALLIAMINVGGLLLARNLGRSAEFTIMRALGASRRVILSHITAQACILSAAGLILAAPIATGFLALARSELPADLPRLDQLSIGGIGWLTGLASALLMAIGSGILGTPWKNDSLQPGLRRSIGHARVLGGILIAQTALAVLLLVAGGLLLRSFLGLRAVDPGINPQRAVAFDLRLPPSLSQDDARIRQFIEQIDESIAALPGVEATGQVQHLPFSGGNWSSLVLDPRNRTGERPPDSDVLVVTPGYPAAIGLPLLAGRAFSDEDRPTGPRVALINEQLARALWPGANPIGRRVIVGMFDDYEAEVVGLVGPVHHRGLAAEARPEVYLPYAQAPVAFSTLVIRGTIGGGLTTRVRQTVRDIQPSATVSRARRMSDLVGRSIATQRMHAFVFGALSVLAVFLAAVGIYGVASFGVTQAVNEIGVRAALGASSPALLLGVLVRAARLVLLGLTLGFAASLILLRGLAPLLYRFTPADPPTYMAVGLTLMAVALVAAFAPARRAASIDPMVAMRSDT